jgi:transcriptional regulator with XRE-family HTH domain
MENVKEALRNAVAYLKGERIIEADKDIAEKTGYKKSAVSLYIKGSSKVSDEFINKFEEVFKLKLGDFATKTPIKKQNQETKMQDYASELINSLKKTIEILERNAEGLQKAIENNQKRIESLLQINSTLKERVQTDLKTVLENQIIHEAAMEARQDMMLEMLAKTPDDLPGIFETVYRKVAELGKAYDGTDMHLKIGTVYKK